MTDNIIPAATILLLRDTPALEVLMVERHADIGFAGGALVFPGGKLEASDYSVDWSAHCDGLEAIDAEEHGPRIGAIREAFEEAGILLARDHNGKLIGDSKTSELNDLRGAVEKEDALFLKMIADHKLRLACDCLSLFARWQPPKEVTHRRYHTWFFAAAAPTDQVAREDGNEATEALWTSPQRALEARDSGSRKMIFPTSRNVELLALSASVENALKDASNRIIDPVEPLLVDRDGKQFLTIPKHLGYPITEESLETAFRS